MLSRKSKDQERGLEMVVFTLSTTRDVMRSFGAITRWYPDKGYGFLTLKEIGVWDAGNHGANRDKMLKKGDGIFVHVLELLEFGFDFRLNGRKRG